MRRPPPEICTTTLLGDVRSLPEADCPTTPSIPIVATSSAVPSRMMVNAESTAPVGKYACSIGLRAS